MNLSDALQHGLKEVPKCVAVGFIDMDTSMVLAHKTTESHPQEVFDFLGAATKDLFEGENVITIEKIFKKSRGVKNDEKYFREIIILSKNLIHVFARLHSNERVISCVVCQGDANLGLVILKAKVLAKEVTV
ncbi:MAG: hypothetical protein AABZ74_02340 [Cyanobacteriota bacterium]